MAGFGQDPAAFHHNRHMGSPPDAPIEPGSRRFGELASEAAAESLLVPTYLEAEAFRKHECEWPFTAAPAPPAIMAFLVAGTRAAGEWMERHYEQAIPFRTTVPPATALQEIGNMMRIPSPAGTTGRTLGLSIELTRISPDIPRDRLCAWIKGAGSGLLESARADLALVTAIRMRDSGLITDMLREFPQIPNFHRALLGAVTARWHDGVDCAVRCLAARGEVAASWVFDEASKYRASAVATPMFPDEGRKWLARRAVGLYEGSIALAEVLPEFGNRMKAFIPADPVHALPRRGLKIEQGELPLELNGMPTRREDMQIQR